MSRSRRCTRRGRTWAFELEPIQHAIQVPLCAGPPLNSKARRFVQRHQIVVTIKNSLAQVRQGRLIRFMGRRVAPRWARVVRQGWHADGLAADQTVARLAAPPVQPDLAGAQQLRQMAVANMRELTAEPAVEAHIGITGTGREMADAGHARTRRISLRPAKRPSTENVTDDRI